MNFIVNLNLIMMTSLSAGGTDPPYQTMKDEARQSIRSPAVMICRRTLFSPLRFWAS